MNSSRLHPRAQRGATALARSPRTAALTIVMLAVATLAALLLPASPGNAADLKFSGTLTKNSKTATHAVTAPKGTLAATLTFFDLPEAGIALILAVDHLLDMGRSATNVVGNSVASAVVAKWENQIEEPEAEPAKA